MSSACDSVTAIVRTAATGAEFKREEGAFNDSYQEQPRVGCRLTGHGKFSALKKGADLTTEIRSAFEAHAWFNDSRIDAAGPDGEDFGARKLDMMCIVLAHWAGHDDSDTTTNRVPTPEEDIYELKLEVVHDVLDNAKSDVSAEWKTASEAGFDSLYAITARYGHPTAEGDFDGDGVEDVAIVVESRATGKLGVVFVLASKRLVVAGAGSAFANGPDDLSGIIGWEVFRRGQINPGFRDRPTLPMTGDAIRFALSDTLAAYLMLPGNVPVWNRVRPRP